MIEYKSQRKAKKSRSDNYIKCTQPPKGSMSYKFHYEYMPLSVIMAYKQAIARMVIRYDYPPSLVADLFDVTTQYVKSCYDEKVIQMRSRQTAKKAGSEFEGAVAKYFTDVLCKPVERRTKHGKNDMGDLQGVSTKSGLECVVECKCEAKPSFSTYLDEAEKERGNAKADVAFVVFKRNGIGYKKNSPMGRQCVIMSYADFKRLIGDIAEATGDLIIGGNGISIGYHKQKYCGKYETSKALEKVENRQDCSHVAYVALMEAYGSGVFVLTTLAELSAILNWSTKG